MKKQDKRYSVPALEKSLVIIETLISAGQPLGISELASTVQIPKSSVFTILSTLEEYGYIEKTDDGKFSMTLKLYHQGLRILNQLDIRAVAKPFMEELARATGYTVHMAQLMNGKAVYIEKVEGPSFVQFSTQIGQSWHLHNSGVGKAIAAYLPENVLERIVEKHGMPQTTPNTISDLSKFKAFLESVRKSGYAIEDEEGEPGVRCIAAPIFDRSGKVAASISVTAVRNELPSYRFHEVGLMVKEKALLISTKLGYIDPEKGDGEHEKSHESINL